MVSRENLINAFKEEVKNADQNTFPIYVDSFTNIWEYEFGSLEDLPREIDDLIAQHAIDVGLMET